MILKAQKVKTDCGEKLRGKNQKRVAERLQNSSEESAPILT
jgi:hypothetical protein